jgi:galacturan 1,4-alpha-galacturonidase
MLLILRVRHVTGNDFVVDGFDTGGVFGNGQTWYSYAHGLGGVYGRYV